VGELKKFALDFQFAYRIQQDRLLAVDDISEQVFHGADSLLGGFE